jgi:glycine cleavage system transcriptional repressor
MSRSALIILATGRDRPGIVDRISGFIYNAGCNLEDSRMGILGGEFSFMVLITGSAESLLAVQGGLPALARELGLTLQLKETLSGPDARKDVSPAIRFRIHAVAMDQPGIVHKLTRILAEHRVNVARLDTARTNAPVSGMPMFSIEMDAEVPAGVPIASLRGQLQRFGEAENIDIEMRAES